MKSIRNKIIHLLGGYTFHDMLVNSKPQPVGVQRCDIRTVRAKNIIRTEMLSEYPDYIETVKKELAYKLADTMLEEHLISIGTEQELTSISISATARIVKPEVIGNDKD